MGRRRSKSPAPRKGARSKKLQAEATTVAKPKATTAAKTKASSSSDVANVALLGVWFGTSIYFNYLTPEFNKYLSAKTDITMVELLSAAAYGVVLLSLGGTGQTRGKRRFWFSLCTGRLTTQWKRITYYWRWKIGFLSSEACLS